MVCTASCSRLILKLLWFDPQAAVVLTVCCCGLRQMLLWFKDNAADADTEATQLAQLDLVAFSQEDFHGLHHRDEHARNVALAHGAPQGYFLGEAFKGQHTFSFGLCIEFFSPPPVTPGCPFSTTLN